MEQWQWKQERLGGATSNLTAPHRQEPSIFLMLSFPMAKPLFQFFGLLFPLIVSLQKRIVHAVQRHPDPNMEARKWRGGRLRRPVITGSSKQVVLSIQILACLPRQASSHVIASGLLRMTLFA
jgi:hypothetical protein